MYREILAILEAAILNRKHGRVSLAIPELCLLRMAEAYAPPQVLREKISFLPEQRREDGASDCDEKRAGVCRAILPGLRYVVRQHLAVIESADTTESQSMARGKRISVAPRPDTHESPELSSVDPHSDSDFACKLCSIELSNVYYHCDGCEKLLSKDFNICLNCYSAKNYCKVIQMHPHNTKRHATINHVGKRCNADTSKYFQCRNLPLTLIALPFFSTKVT